MGTLTDKRGTEIQMLTLGDSSDWRSEVAKGNLVTIWKTCSSPEEMAENNLVIQNHIGVLGDWPWDTKPLVTAGQEISAGEKDFPFSLGISWGKNK